ncbi:MAG: AAA family ATPase [Nitrospira sp.]|nr:AAA family ATPase [Nitrospira sp.]
MTASIWIDKLHFNDGTVLNLTSRDIVLFVGPNNVGKSTALQTIYDSFCDRGSNAPPIVTSVEVIRNGTEHDLEEWLMDNCAKSAAHGESYVVKRLGRSDSVDGLKRMWFPPGDPRPSGVCYYFSFFVPASQRLELANPANAVSHDGSLTHPIHYLYKNEVLEERISKSFNEAFGQELVVDRLAGQHIPIRIGKRPQRAPGEDRLSYGYASKVASLPFLHQQGDGMRSFAGALLATTVLNTSVTLVDEPEAFLHPPHARLLGRMMARDKPHDVQLIVASHSGDFLRGLLDSENSPVRVVRISRDDAGNHFSELQPDNIRQFWNDPLLRYSNFLDGLFHEMVVLTESDGDARFYGAMLDAIYDKQPEVARPDLMFTHCGGKDRMPKLIKAMRALAVPMRVIVDFDILSAEQPLRPIVEALGGNWAEIGVDWRRLASTIRDQKAELDADDVKREINSILKEVSTKHFPQELAKRIRDVVRRTSPWSILKHSGRHGVPSGDATQCLDRLISSLKKIGLLVVEEGELECFDKGVGNDGPAWVNEVLKKDLLNDPVLESARRFVRSIVTH